MKRILVVDDDRHIAAILNELLSIDGYKVEVAYSANEALKLFNECPFDLIITDILMPHTDGIAFIAKVRETSQIPIIAMSGGRRALTPANLVLNENAANLKLGNALKFGANALLKKPFLRAQLQQTILNTLE